MCLLIHLVCRKYLCVGLCSMRLTSDVCNIVILVPYNKQNVNVVSVFVCVWWLDTVVQ
jgi:hypothetical protein